MCKVLAPKPVTPCKTRNDGPETGDLPLPTQRTTPTAHPLMSSLLASISLPTRFGRRRKRRNEEKEK